MAEQEGRRRGPEPLGGFQQKAAQFYFLMMLFAFPIFNVPCPRGICTSPVDVVATYLFCKGLASDDVVRTILYPGEFLIQLENIVGDMAEGISLPSWDGVLKSRNLTSELAQRDQKAGSFYFPSLLTMFDREEPIPSLNLGFVGGCVLCLIGAILSMFGPSKWGTSGVLVLIWYIFIEGGNRSDVFVLPLFSLAIFCSCGWVNLKEMFSGASSKNDRAPAGAAQSKVEYKKKK